VELNAKLQTELADPKNFDGVTSFEGMIGLAGEIVKKKIASEEETWSGQSLLIFDSNWDGILSQAKPFYVPAGKSPKLKELGTKVEDAIKDAKKCIDKYRKVGTTTTYDDYSTMPVNGLVDGRECVVKQGYAVMQALVDLAKEVGVFDDCSPFHHGSVYTYRHEGEHPKGETGGV
jgi:iron uptake system component EfeO